MALTKVLRHRAPLDGTTFRTMASLQSILRSASRYDDEMTWPKIVEDTRVPVYIRMAKYKAQETRERPDGMIYGPIVRIGSNDSPDLEMFGHHHAAGLCQDYHLDGLSTTDKWLYHPIDGDVFPPGEDASFYRCSQCNESLYRDDMGRRFDRSACVYDGALACRGCDVRGLVYDGETAEQLERAQRLADYVGGDTRKRFDNCIERLGQGFCFGSPSQTRLFREDKFSFNWSVLMFTKEGKKRGMNGGLIQHGPHPIEDGEKFKFRTWDYGLKAERDATHDEIRNISWSIHT